MTLSDRELFPYVREVGLEAANCQYAIDELRSKVASVQAIDSRLEMLHAAGQHRTTSDEVARLEADRRVEYDRVFFYAHAFLIHAANISKLLWPKPKSAARGSQLRAILSVPGQSPLNKRSRRNDLEHIDERLEQWIAAKRSQGIDPVLGDMNMAGSARGSDGFRHLDPTSLDYSFQGNTSSLLLMEQECQRLLNEADRCLCTRGFRR
jgi:hypothetical protein